MAGLKKPSKKKDTTKPGTVLIMFLVFFILLSIGLGVWGYYGYDGQHKLREDAKAKQQSADARGKAEKYRTAQMGLLLAAATGKDLHDDVKGNYTNEVDEVIKKQGSAYSGEKDQGMFADLFLDMEKELGGFDGGTKKFKDNYRDRHTANLAQLKSTQTDLEKTRKALASAQADFKTYQTKIEQFKTSMDKAISSGNAEAKKAAEDKYQEIISLLDMNQKILTEKLELETKQKALEETLIIEKIRYNKLLEQKKEGTVEIVQSKKETSDRHALFLDISRGIPLWDRPLGKVARVNLEKREVYIGLGSTHGVRPGLSFNVFADDGKGNADRYLKGTIEVVRAIDANTSLARMTSLYDSQGREIAMNDPLGGRIARETEAAMREGDLLFNMFWNAHVAIAGAVNVPGSRAEAPSEQMRQMATFVQNLERVGIHVDAVLDLTDGQVKGALSNKTQFLILGDYAQAKDPTDEAQQERAKMINDAITAMRKDAIDKGLYLISTANFAIAAGVRVSRNGASLELGGFRSGPPTAGTAGQGLIIQRDRPLLPGAAPDKEKAPAVEPPPAEKPEAPAEKPAAKPPEKKKAAEKEAEKKEPEKKDEKKEEKKEADKDAAQLDNASSPHPSTIV